jgi:hypothetical protein
MLRSDIPETAFLRAPRMKALLLLLGSLGFVALGVIILRDGQTFGWLVIGFFGLGVPVALLMLFGKSGLLLDRAGFEMPVFGGRRRYAWRDVSEFEVVTIYTATMIVFDDLKSNGFLAHANSAVCGRNAGIGAALISGDIHQACALLNAFRNRALVGQP